MEIFDEISHKPTKTMCKHMAAEACVKDRGKLHGFSYEDLGGFSLMGLLFIISAPAGTGKTTLVSMLLNEFAGVVRSVSYTTRERRADEVDGKDYFFIDRSEFEKRIEKGNFWNTQRFFGNLYGTSKKFVDEKLKANKHVVLVIDTQGAMKLQSSLESKDAVFIFVRPPSLEEQRKRLLKRHTESEEAIENQAFLGARRVASCKRLRLSDRKR